MSDNVEQEEKSNDSEKVSVQKFYFRTLYTTFNDKCIGFIIIKYQ